MSKTKKMSLNKTIALILAACLVIGLVMTGVVFFGKSGPASASTQLQFTFDGAADGIAPNGSNYNVSDLSSDEVLSAALAAASLDGNYTAADIRPYLVVKGVYPEDMAAQVMSYESLLNFTSSRELTVNRFFPTTYSITLYDSFDPSISGAQLKTLLTEIISAYRDYFAVRYANNLQDSVLMFDLSQYDYPQQLAIIQSQLEVLTGYAMEMYEVDPTFSFEGQGFNDIAVRFTNLINSDIDRMNASLTMNALTRNTTRLLIQYQYEIRNLNNQLEKKTNQLKMMDSLIDSYEKNEIIYLSTSDSLVKIDGNSSETYDSLVDVRKDVAEEITEINSNITTNTLKMSDLLKDSDAPADETQETGAEDSNEDESTHEVMTEAELKAATEAAAEQSKRQIAALEGNIDQLQTKRDTVIADFSKLLDAYNKREINDLTVAFFGLRYNAPKLLSGAFIKTGIKVAGPIFALGFMACMVLLIQDQRKKYKAAAK